MYSASDHRTQRIKEVLESPRLSPGREKQMYRYLEGHMTQKRHSNPRRSGPYREAEQLHPKKQSKPGMFIGIAGTVTAACLLIAVFFAFRSGRNLVPEPQGAGVLQPAAQGQASVDANKDKEALSTTAVTETVQESSPAAPDSQANQSKPYSLGLSYDPAAAPDRNAPGHLNRFDLSSPLADKSQYLNEETISIPDKLDGDEFNILALYDDEQILVYLQKKTTSADGQESLTGDGYALYNFRTQKMIRFSFDKDISPEEIAGLTYPLIQKDGSLLFSSIVQRSDGTFAGLYYANVTDPVIRRIFSTADDPTLNAEVRPALITQGNSRILIYQAKAANGSSQLMSIDIDHRVDSAMNLGETAGFFLLPDQELVNLVPAADGKSFSYVRFKITSVSRQVKLNLPQGLTAPPELVQSNGKCFVTTSKDLGPMGIVTYLYEPETERVLMAGAGVYNLYKLSANEGFVAFVTLSPSDSMEAAAVYLPDKDVFIQISQPDPATVNNIFASLTGEKLLAQTYHRPNGPGTAPVDGGTFTYTLYSRK